MRVTEALIKAMDPDCEGGALDIRRIGGILYPIWVYLDARLIPPCNVQANGPAQPERHRVRHGHMLIGKDTNGRRTLMCAILQAGRRTERPTMTIGGIFRWDDMG